MADEGMIRRAGLGPTETPKTPKGTNFKREALEDIELIDMEAEELFEDYGDSLEAFTRFMRDKELGLKGLDYQVRKGAPDKSTSKKSLKAALKSLEYLDLAVPAALHQMMKRK